MFTSEYDIYTIYDSGMVFLPHHYNDPCLVRNPGRTFMFQKLENIRVINDYIKHQFMPLPNYYSVACLKILQFVGLTEKLHIDDDGIF